MASNANASATAAKNAASASKTVTDTIVGEHTHTIIGYSLVKGIGDGEPIASERFMVGGHEWVLLFYPDGKRSSSSEAGMEGAPANPALPAPVAGHPAPLPIAPPPPQGAADMDVMAMPAANVPVPHHAFPPGPPGYAPLQGANLAGRAPQRPQRDTTNEYAALFVALIGEGPNPQGVVNTNEGKVVRAFHRFTLVDQGAQGRDLTKGRTREAGAVKISCQRQDPNARNCHGYRKFVKRQVLEDPSKGFLVNDTIVIKYTIELVVSTGGALSKSNSQKPQQELIKVPPPNLGAQLGELLASNNGADFIFLVEGEEIKVHKVIMEARSNFFRAIINNQMREGQEGRAVIQEIKAAVFRVMLHFVYTDTLPEEHDGNNLDVAMAQHLLVAADLCELPRLRRICERRLCETVDVETVATTLALSEKNNAEELKKVCLDFVSRHLAEVMKTEGYKYMTESCPKLQAEILATIAATSNDRHKHHHGTARPREHDALDDARRVRPRKD